MKSGTIQMIVALLPERVVALDVGSGAMQEVARSGGEGGGAALRRLFQKYPLKRGCRVVVGSTEFFNQEVRLPEMQVRGLSEGELLSALLFEVEPFSNISAAQGVAGLVPRGVIDGIQSWSVTQIELREMRELQGAVSAARGRFAGAVYLSGVMLSGGGAAEGGVEEALGGVATAINSGVSDSPVVRLMGVSPLVKVKGFLPWVVLLAVVVGCVAHYVVLRRDVVGLRSSSRELEMLAGSVAQQEGVNKGLQKRLTTVEEEKVAQRKAQESLNRYRSAWHTFISGLLNACDESMVIQKIDGGGLFECRVSGLSSAERGPSEFFARLEDELKGSGWQVESESMHSSVPASASHKAVRFNFRAVLDLPDSMRRQAVVEEYPW